MRCSIGSANAAVLPVPVAACAEQVAAVEQQRNRFALDRRGLFVAERGDRGDDVVREAESGEAGGNGGFFFRRWHQFQSVSCCYASVAAYSS